MLAVIAAGAGGVLLFVAGAGTSAVLAGQAQHRVAVAYQENKSSALALYEDDVTNRKTLSDMQDQVTAARNVMLALRAEIDTAPWVSQSAREAFDSATTDITTYGPGGAPGEPLPRPRTTAIDWWAIATLRNESDRLRLYVVDHQADHDATKDAAAHLTTALADAKSAIQLVMADAMTAGQPVPTT
ncbi:hypothetical protein ACI2IX_01150 [Leifsonia aquatica]|uniref:hypothetical protein n=1 Tax=Leifsonia aquatica TaxID=144185 RepID=UPI00384C8FD3